MTLKTIKRTDDSVCPMCGSNDLYGDGDWGIENGYVWVRINCCTCNASYTDVYRMAESDIWYEGDQPNGRDGTKED